MHPLLFADRARKIMQLAGQEAFRLNHESIGTKHILLGLLTEGSGVTPSVLKKLDHEFRKIRTALGTHVESGPSIVMVGKLPYTPEAKKAMNYADEEARNSGHPCVETEHILLGLLREPEGIAGQVLTGLDLNAKELRTEIDGILHQPHRIADASPFMPGHN